MERFKNCDAVKFFMKREQKKDKREDEEKYTYISVSLNPLSHMKLIRVCMRFR